VRVVRVPLEDEVVSFSRGVVETGEVGRSQAEPTRSDEEVDPALGGLHGLHRLGRAVGRAVVHDQHIYVRDPEHVTEQIADALALVVGRDHHEGTGVRR
jgi:hypothetical protein